MTTEDGRGASTGVRAAHLLRINSYMDIAIISMWTASPRAGLLMEQAEASLRGEGPGGSDEDFLKRLRGLVREAIECHSGDDFPAAMARMRVAHDLLALRLIRLAEA